MPAPSDQIQVIVGYDFTPTAEEALRRAIEVACHAPEHVLHVVTAIDAHDGVTIAPTHDITHDYSERIKRIVTKRVADMLAGRAHASDVKFIVHTPIGAGANEILALTRSLGASLVFVGSHGKTTAEKVRLGSVSERIVREAHCSVVVARGREPVPAERANESDTNPGRCRDRDGSRSPDVEIVGHIAYIDPSKQWGYVYGPVGERVYFNAMNIDEQRTRLEIGTEIRYLLSGDATQVRTAQVIRCVRPGQ